MKAHMTHNPFQTLKESLETTSSEINLNLRKQILFLRSICPAEIHRNPLEAPFFNGRSPEDTLVEGRGRMGVEEFVNLARALKGP